MLLAMAGHWTMQCMQCINRILKCSPRTSTLLSLKKFGHALELAVNLTDTFSMDIVIRLIVCFNCLQLILQP